jgi:nicotinamide riboside kinase
MEKNLKQVRNTEGPEILKIVLFGPESTGKTTLAIQLAGHFETAWVPEFARDYLQKKWDTSGQVCELSDMLPIAFGQTQLENESLSKANSFLFCDTNLMVTKVFSEVYYNYCDPALDKAARKHEYDLFFLTDIDVPWEKDDLRDKPEGRAAVFQAFKQSLIDNNKPFVTLRGDKESRLKKAILILEELEKAKKLGFSSSDFLQIREYGIPLKKIVKQFNYYNNGIAKAVLVKPALVSSGIVKFSDDDIKQKAQFFDANKTNLKLIKFVPASGAASRMFQFLNEFLNEFDNQKESIHAYINRKKANELPVFIVGLEKFPFFDEINAKLKTLYSNYNTLEKDVKDFYFIKTMLAVEHFNYANKPKAVLPFHKYKSHIATPIEEHLYECTRYSSAHGHSNLHFTVTETHQTGFEKVIENVKRKVETETQTQIEVSFSYQNTATDILAVDDSNKPFREASGKLLFRPGGHGALIENLNNLEGDVIFVKNIDNVIQSHVEINTLYKKALAGIMIELQQQIFKYLTAIDNGQEIDVKEIIDFAKTRLNIKVSKKVFKYTLEYQKEYIKKILDRPIRICGMVRNEGDTGGGPFWVRNPKGTVSLQIVETSQIDLSNQEQAKIFSGSTHFNPVDLVCGIQNYKGIKFNLADFVDANSGFIVQKNKDGKPLKSYELPGLWNGAMAKWISVFVEVPLITFNPVKTVNDLLKEPHQPQ